MKQVVAIENEGTLWKLLKGFLDAYKERTQVLKGMPPIGETSIKQDLKAIIEMLMSLGSLPGRQDQVETRLETIHGLVFDLTQMLQQRRKMKGTIMSDYAIPDNQPDGRVTFNLSATDEEGQAITDPAELAKLQFEVMSTNDAAFVVTLDADQPDPAKRVGGYHAGSPGQAAVTSNLKNADGEIIGTGTDGFTVTTGKATIGAVKSEFDGLTPIV